MRTSEVLDEEVVPERELVEHREAELDRLLARLDPTGGLADLCYLIGPTGTGKTMLAKLTLRLLRERDDARTAYLNCWRYHERRPILAQVVEALCDEVVDRQTTATARLADAVGHLDDAGDHTVVRQDRGDLHLGVRGDDDAPGVFTAAVTVEGAIDRRGDGAEAVFSNDYFTDAVAALKTALVDEVTLAWGDDFPLKLQFERTDDDTTLYSGTWMIAPRLSNNGDSDG